MKVLLVGGGGREHALAMKLLADEPSLELICAPGNAGIAEICDCIPVKATDIGGLAAFAQRANVDLTVVGPEAPLELGIVEGVCEIDHARRERTHRIRYASLND